MNARRMAPKVVILLIAIGLAAVNTRMSFRQRTSIFRGDTIWRLAQTSSFRATKAGAKLRSAFPLDTPYSHVLHHEVAAGELNVAPLRPGRSENRELLAVAQQPGDFVLRAQFDLQLSGRGGWRSNAADTKLTAEARASYLKSESNVQVDSPIVSHALEGLYTDSPSVAELVERVFEYCQTEIAPGGKDAPHDAAGALTVGTASPLGRARTMIALCRAAKLPARLVTGFEIRIGAAVLPHRWVEVLTNGHWESFDPENGYARELPRHFIPVRRNGREIVHGTDVAGLQTMFSIVRLPAPPEAASAGERRPVEILDLTRLPIELHEPLALVLLLPLGALVTVIFRTIIGVRTFGTFSPTLLALAFVYNDWRIGMIVFAMVLVMGVTSRSLLNRLKLLVVPRLSVILTLVVLCMVFAVSIWDYFGLLLSGQTVLLPMVILTMTVERFFLASEEDGVRFALRLLAGTLVVAFCCYMVLRWQTVGHWLLVYPELHLFTIGVLILLGRYSGYRLTELWRFRDLAGAEK